jgi:hypothetical protein
MLSGGFEIWGYDVSLSHLDDNISDAAGAVYDNVIAPVGSGIAWAAEAEYDFYSQIPKHPERIIIAIPGVNLLALAGAATIGCGRSTPPQPAPDAQDAPPAPPAAPEFPGDETLGTPAYYQGVYKYLEHYSKNQTGFSYANPQVPTIEPCLTMTQGIFELLCYGVLNGKITEIKDENMSKCGSWLVPNVSPQTCGNDIQFVDNTAHTMSTNNPYAAYVAQMLGLPMLPAWPAITDVRHELRMAAADYGIPVKLAFEHQTESQWTAFQPKLVTELGNYFAQRSQDACFVITNEEQDLFNRIKMINADAAAFVSPWEKVNTFSTPEVARNTDWMTPLLTAGAITQMMMDFSNANLKTALANVKSGEWRITTKTENNVQVKYIRLGRQNNSPTVPLIDYLNNGMWTSAVPAKDKAEILARAEAAYQTARSRCPECMPDIDNPAVADCLKAIKPEETCTLDPGTLVAWQIIQMRGLFGEQGAERFQARGGRRSSGTTTTTGGGERTCIKTRPPNALEISQGNRNPVCIQWSNK